MKNECKLMVISRGMAPMVFGGTILLNNLISEYPGSIVAVAGPANKLFSDPRFHPFCKTFYHNIINHQLYSTYYDLIIHYSPILLKTYLNRHISQERPSIIMA